MAQRIGTPRSRADVAVCNAPTGNRSGPARRSARRGALRVVPAPAERDLRAVFLDELRALRGRPAEVAGEHAGDALADPEALVAADQQQRDATSEDVLDGARQIVGRGELDLGPHVRQLAIEALAERAGLGDCLL